MDDEDDHEDECINCSQDIDWKFIANVRKNIEDNIDNPALTVDVLCNLMGMSRTSFYNKLRALTDQAPGDYIRLIRLKRSVKLLKEGTQYNRNSRNDWFQRCEILPGSIQEAFQCQPEPICETERRR